jgi:hypothetical protein
MIVKDVQGSPGSTGAGLCQYIAESGIERELDADGARSLFSDDSDSLSVDQANHLLGRGMEIEKGELIHVVISLRAEEFESLGESESERREELTAFVREAVLELAEELKVDNLEYAAAIHRNTPNPHVHLAVSRFARSIETQRLVRIDHLPRDLWSRRDDDGSRTPFRERLYDAFEARTRERRDRDRDDNGRDTEHEPLPAPTSPERVVAGPHFQPREYQLTERSDPVAESSPKGDASSTDVEQTRDHAGDDAQPQPNGDETRREVATASPSEWADPRLRPNLVTELLAARERARAGDGSQPSRAPATAELPSGARAISDRAIAETLGRRLAAELRAKHAAWLLEKVQSRRDVLRYEVSERRVSADGTVRSVNRILSPNDVARRAEARAQGSAGRQSFERSAERDEYLADAYHREIDRDIPTVAEIDERHDAHVADLEAKLERANASLERTLAETAWAASVDTEARMPSIASRDLARLERQALSRQDTGDFRMLDGLRTGAREPEDTGLLRGTARVATTSRASAERRLSDFERDRHSRRVEIRGEHVSLATLDRERLRLERARETLDRGLVHLAASRDSRLGPLPRLAARLIEPVGRPAGDGSSPLAELRSVEAELARNERDRAEAGVLLDGKHADLASDLYRARELENALGVAIGREVEYARAEGRDLAPEVLRPFEAQRIEADAIARRDPELLRDIAETTDGNLGSELAAARRAEGRALAAETLVLAARERQERFEFFDTVVPVRIRERDGSESLARARDDAPAAVRLAPVDRNRPPTGDTFRDVLTGRVSVELSAGALARRIFARPAERERMERVTEAVAAERDRLARELAEARALAGAAREIADRRLEEAKSAKIDERSVREAPVFLVEEAAEMERYLAGARPSAEVERLSNVLEDAIDSSRVVRPDMFDRSQSPGEARDTQRPDSLDRQASRRVSPLRSARPDRSESPTRSPGDLTRTTESISRLRNIAGGTRENSRARPGETPTRSAEVAGGRSPGLDRTLGQMRAQIRALGGTVEIGIGNGRGAMQQRVITTADIERVAGYLRHSNARGSHIYVRPTESIGLVLMDDVRRDTLDQLRRDGLAPAAIVETSPGNHQAWIRLSDKPIERELASAAARDLARTYGTDERGAAWNHYGRLAGFTNPKPQYAGERGFPFSELRGSSGQVAQRGAAVLDRARSALELERTIDLARDLSRPSAPERPAPTAPDPDPKASYDRVAALAPPDVVSDRSRLDWRVATTLSREGRERDWIRSALERGNDGIADRGKSPGYVDRTVDKAMRETSRSFEREPSRDR